MQPYTILLVDDDEEDYLIIKEALSECDAGQVLEYAVGGKRALAFLQEQYGKGHALPKLILLDLNMQVMDGVTTLRKLKEDERFRHIKVLIYSTTIHPHVEKECMQLGAIGCVQKPHSMDEISLVGEQLLVYCR